MADITVADKLYVTVQGRADANSESGHLGFASPYTKDANFKKRKITQDQWAYGYGTDWVIDEDDEITAGPNHRSEYEMIHLFVTQAYPRIVKNEPREGFEIAKSVRRYGYRGPGNVLWRITDPAGYDLEISSENFASIVDHCVMEKGVIKGRCVWGRDGNKNVLLPEGSEPYDLAMRLTKQTKNTVSLKDVTVGDTIEILNKGMTGIPFTYLGKMFIHCADRIKSPDSGRSYYSSDAGTNLDAKIVERYVIQRHSDNKLVTVSTLKVAEITGKADGELTREMAARMVNDMPHIDFEGLYEQVSFVSVEKNPSFKVDLQEMTTSPYTDGGFKRHEQHYTAFILVQHNGSWYRCANKSEYQSGGGSTYTGFWYNLEGIPFENGDTRAKASGQMVQSSGHVWNRYTQWENYTTDPQLGAKYYTAKIVFDNGEERDLSGLRSVLR